MSAGEMELMLAGHGLTTAQIYYRMPDYRTMIQSYLWQEYDLAPEFPKLHGFLDFWQENLDGPIHSVQFTHQQLIRPGEWKRVDCKFRLH